MTATATHQLMEAASARGAAVPAFNVITLEHAEGIVEGLARAGSGGILQLSERALAFRTAPIEAMIVATSTIADAAETPVSVHLDHIQDVELATRLINAAPDLGVTSIMVDFAHVERTENERLTREFADLAHGRGLYVEAELGEIGGKDGAHAAGARTDPDDARAFVASTGVDALAVAIGSSHAMATRDAALDLELLGRLASAVPVPLVLHGSSGVSDAELVAAVRAGIRKVNVGTALNASLTSSVRDVLAAKPQLTDPRDYLGAGRSAIAATVAEFCRVLSTATAEGGNR